VDEAWNTCLPGRPGEIAIRGDNITAGYAGNPSVNGIVFRDSWFRTGDLGVLDEDGYLSISGRTREMVNRGGEKIAPREVDEALLEHADVVEAVAFGVLHRSLGEDLVAAVVLKDRSKTTEQELRAFLFSRLAHHKVPSQIVIVKEIPKSPTGKVQRVTLATRLSAQLKADYARPRHELEERLAKIWEHVLKVDRVGVLDNFFALGGDSLSAVAVVLEVERLTGRHLEPASLFQAPTIGRFAPLVRGEPGDTRTFLIPLQPNGKKKPLFLVPGHGGDPFTYSQLAQYLGTDQPVYAFRFPEAARLDDKVASRMTKEMATLYAEAMRGLQPDGPYSIGGFCFGGEVAFEMGQQLRAQGQKTDLLAIIFVYLSGAMHLSGYRERIRHHVRSFNRTIHREKAAYVVALLKRALERSSRRLIPSVTRTLVPPPRDRSYFPLYYPGRITLFQPTGDRLDGVSYDAYMGWKGLAADVHVCRIPGTRYSIFREPDVRELARRLRNCLSDTAIAEKAEWHHDAKIEHLRFR